MTSLAIAAVAGVGVYLFYTSIAFGWRKVRIPGTTDPSTSQHHLGQALQNWLTQAGLEGIRPREFVLVVLGLFLLGLGGGYVLFGGTIAPLTIAIFAATFPVAAYRGRREARRSSANEAWPRVIDEIRVLTSSAGRSIPQALFDAGRRAPEAMRSAFDAANREWLLTTDFERALTVLKRRLADPTADAACETLLISYEVGGGDLEQKLEALAEDRRQDVQGRKDARARQASVRFARNFVLIVPVGMALAGMSVGTGRDAYATPQGQLFVAAGVGMVVVCWLWAGHLMKLPEQDRVFPD